MRQRRRAERGQFSNPHSPRRNRREIEAKQRQLLWIGAGFVLFVIIGFLSWGWYSTYYAPPHKTVTTVIGAPIKLKQLIPYTAIDAFYSSNGQLDPATSLNNMIRDEVTQHYAGELGVQVTDQQITQGIIRRFDTSVSSTTPDDELPSTLSAAAQQSYDSVLSSLKLTDAQYRDWLRGQLYLTAIHDHFVAAVPDPTQQVYVQWFVTGTQQAAQDGYNRIASGTDDFLTVAKDVNQESGLSSPVDDSTGATTHGDGIIGWVPKGAFPSLDSTLFSSDLVLNKVYGPIATGNGYVVLRVTDGPSDQPVSDKMKQLVGVNDFQNWLNQKITEANVSTPDLTNGDITWVDNHIG